MAYFHVKPKLEIFGVATRISFLMRALLQDVRHSLRSLRKAHWFALVAISILALGIAASTVIFSLLDSVLLAPSTLPRC